MLESKLNINLEADYRSLIGYAGIYRCSSHLSRHHKSGGSEHQNSVLSGSVAAAVVLGSNQDLPTFGRNISNSSLSDVSSLPSFAARPVYPTKSFPVAAVPGYANEQKHIPIGAEVFRRYRSEPQRHQSGGSRQRHVSSTSFYELAEAEEDLLEMDPMLFNTTSPDHSSFSDSDDDFGDSRDLSVTSRPRLTFKDCHGLPLPKPAEPALVDELAEVLEDLQDAKLLDSQSAVKEEDELLDKLESIFLKSNRSTDSVSHVTKKTGNRHRHSSKRRRGLRDEIADFLDSGGVCDMMTSSPVRDLLSDGRELVIPDSRPGELVPHCGVVRVVPGVPEEPVSEDVHPSDHTRASRVQEAADRVLFTCISTQLVPHCGQVKLLPADELWRQVLIGDLVRPVCVDTSDHTEIDLDLPPLCGSKKYECTTELCDSVSSTCEQLIMEGDTRKVPLNLPGELSPLVGGSKYLPGVHYEPVLPVAQRESQEDNNIFVLVPDVTFDQLPDLIGQIQVRDDCISRSPRSARVNLGPYLKKRPSNICVKTRANELELLLLRVCDLVFAVSARCPHAGGPLAMGDVEALYNGDCVLRCPWHGYTFNLHREGVIHEPRTRQGDLRLKMHPVRVEPDGKLRLGFSSLSQLWFAQERSKQLEF